MTKGLQKRRENDQREFGAFDGIEGKGAPIGKGSNNGTFYETELGR